MKIRRRKTRVIRNLEAMALFQKHGELSATTARRLWNTWTAVIVCALQQGHTVQVTGLGTFKPTLRRAYNVKYGRVVPESYRVYFSTSRGLLKLMGKPDLARQRLAAAKRVSHIVGSDLADADSVDVEQ